MFFYEWTTIWCGIDLYEFNMFIWNINLIMSKIYQIKLKKIRVWWSWHWFLSDAEEYIELFLSLLANEIIEFDIGDSNVHVTLPCQFIKLNIFDAKHKCISKNSLDFGQWVFEGLWGWHWFLLCVEGGVRNRIISKFIGHI